VNADVTPHLALILFLPWYAVLAWVFWRMRARHARARRKLAALAFIVGALLAAGWAGVWAFENADTSVGALWKQLLASSVGYAAYLSVLLAGFAVLRSPVTRLAGADEAKRQS